MIIYILVASDKTINGVYTSKNQLIADLSTTLSNVTIDKIEEWEPNKGFIDYLKVNKQTIVTIED